MSAKQSPAVRLITDSQFKFPDAWTLLLPSVGVGNVAQLAVDLFLTSFEVQHIGHLHSTLILPFAAPAPVVPSHRYGVVMGFELYALKHESSTLLILQQRSPSIPGQTAELAKEIMNWAIGNGCNEVLLLSSGNAAGLRGVHLTGLDDNNGTFERLRVAHTSPAGEDGRLGIRATKELKWKVLENVDSDSRGWSESCCNNVQLDLLKRDASVPAFAPSSRKGSYVRTVLEECEGKNIALTTLMLFVHEGDNITDSICMASAAKDLLCLPSAANSREHSGEAQRDKVASFWIFPQAWVEPNEVPNELY